MDRDRYNVAMRCAPTGATTLDPLPIPLTIDSSSLGVACTLQDKAPTNVIATALGLTA